MSTFEIGSISVFNCLWSHFPENLNKVTGLSLFFFGVGGITWELLFTFLINPQNREASIYDRNSNMNLFEFEIVKNTGIVLSFLLLMAGLLYVGGSWLISKKAVLEPEEQE